MHTRSGVVGRCSLLLAASALLVSGEAGPDLQLVGFGDLLHLAQGGQRAHSVQSPRDERSLFNTYPFNQQQQANGVSQLALGLFGRGGPTLPQQQVQQIEKLNSLESGVSSGYSGFSGFSGFSGYNNAGTSQLGFGDRLQVSHAAGNSAGLHYAAAAAAAAVVSPGAAHAVHSAAAVSPAAAHAVHISPASASPLAPAAAPTNGGGVVGNYEHLYHGIGATSPLGPSSLKARRPLAATQLQQQHHGPLPEIQVAAAVPARLPVTAVQPYGPPQLPSHVHVEPAAPPAVRLPPAAVYAPEPQQQTDFELFNALNPHRARKPALGREPGPVLGVVAEARERCIDKIEQVEETVYDDVEECSHTYDKKCHTSYSTEYTSQQEEECKESFSKDCDITYSPSAHNQTVLVCSKPLVKDCNIPGPEECRTEYVSECWSKEEVHNVVDDVAECETVYDQKCHQEQNGYSTEEKCSKWPREVCSVNKKLQKKVTPSTKCEKVPQKLCGPAGCGFVPGPEQCYEKTVTIVTDLPSESCNLHPRTQCEHVTKLVPKLVPVEECVDVPKEICNRVRGPPRTVLKPITKKWCYVPTPESGLQ